MKAQENSNTLMDKIFNPGVGFLALLVGFFFIDLPVLVMVDYPWVFLGLLGFLPVVIITAVGITRDIKLGRL